MTTTHNKARPPHERTGGLTAKRWGLGLTIVALALPTMADARSLLGGLLERGPCTLFDRNLTVVVGEGTLSYPRCNTEMPACNGGSGPEPYLVRLHCEADVGRVQR